MRALTCCLLALLAGCAASRPAPRPSEESPAAPARALRSSALSERGQAAWLAHVAESTQPGHQSACEARRYAPASEPRGVVVMFHGFTGCPDQYDGLGPALAAQGYEALAPLLPGHGLLQPTSPPGTKLVDDATRLPGRDDWTRYQEFAAKWADFLAEARGTRAVVGMSLGGTVASLAVGARPEAIDRALIVVPFFSLSNDFVKVLLGVAAGVDALLKANPIDPVEGNWGPECEDDRRDGRGGYCSFRVTHVAAVQLSGMEAQRGLRAARSLPQLQLVVVDHDPAVDSALAVDLLREVAPRSRSGRSGVCTYAASVPHSFVSPKDKPHLDKPWLDAFTAATTGFLAGGAPFAEGACPGNPAPPAKAGR
ncbi:MAG TPA: alpha/beta fold hydrolase [Myxococcales bacterium]|nr:alpha/beta fold hydrolase [Myxococcales bacterium]